MREDKRESELEEEERELQSWVKMADLRASLLPSPDMYFCVFSSLESTQWDRFWYLNWIKDFSSCFSFLNLIFFFFPSNLIFIMTIFMLEGGESRYHCTKSDCVARLLRLMILFYARIVLRNRLTGNRIFFFKKKNLFIFLLFMNYYFLSGIIYKLLVLCN